jgi:hypothetical protein
MVGPRTRQSGVPVLACWLALSTASPFVAPALARTTAAQEAAGCAELSGELDANGDGNPDLVVGVPREDVVRSLGGREYADAGSVTIVYGDADGVLGWDGGRSIGQEQVGLTSESSDRFGASLAIGDVDGNGCADLIVGEPGEDAGAGQVIVIPADENGLDLAKRTVLRQGRGGVAGRSEADDRFGSAVDWSPDGLWIGAPYEDLAGAKDAGVVTTFSGSSSVVASRELAQGQDGIPGKPERGDHFGMALAAGQAVGAPGEDVTRVGTDAGLVAVFDPDQGWGRAAQGASAGDRLGAAVAGGGELLMAGAPGDDVGKAVDAGSVRLLAPLVDTLTLADAGRKPVAGDRFGASLVSIPGHSAIGIPGRDVGKSRNAGAVAFAWAEYEGEEEDGEGWIVELGSVVTQDSARVSDKAESSDAFGASLGVGVRGWLAVGAPGETDIGRVGSGAVTILKQRVGPTLTQSGVGVPGASEAGDGFGAALAGN